MKEQICNLKDVAIRSQIVITGVLVWAILLHSVLIYLYIATANNLIYIW